MCEEQCQVCWRWGCAGHNVRPTMYWLPGARDKGTFDRFDRAACECGAVLERILLDLIREIRALGSVPDGYAMLDAADRAENRWREVADNG